MPGALNAREDTLISLFSDRCDYVAPAYQREYAWREEDAGRLFDDVWLWAQGLDGDEQPRRSLTGESPYFLGSLLFVRQEGEDRALIIDGHQRLMTLTILFATLRDLETARDRRAALHDLIRRRSRPLIGQNGGWRVATLDRDQAFFAQHIQTDGATRRAAELAADFEAPEAQRRMIAAAALFRRRLKAEPARTRRAFVKRVLTECYVARMTVNDEDAAFAMFEVINQRGLPLSPTDVLKARLLTDFERGSERERAAAAAWARMEADFPAAAHEREPVSLFERFLSIAARAHGADHRAPANAGLVRRFQAAVSPAYTPAEILERVLPAYARAYAAFAPAPARTPWGHGRIDRVCEFLSWWEDEEWAGVAARVLVTHGDTPDTCAAILAKLERVAAILTLASERKDRRLRDYQRMLRAAEDVDALLAPDGPMEPRPELARAARDRLDEPLPFEKSVRRAILARANAALDPGQDPPTGSRAGTIEHILPRAAARGGVAGESYPEWSRREVRRAVERLGNLTLVDDAQNARADKRAYGEKIKIFFPASDRPHAFALTEDLRVNGADVWTPETWAARHDRLVALLAREWGLPADRDGAGDADGDG